MRRSDHQTAIQFRRNGATYQEIMQRFGMTKSTLWRWLKAEGLVDGQSQHYTERRLLAQRKAAEVVRRARLQRTEAIVTEARQAIGSLTTRDLWMLGIALYWAEGTKEKPYNVGQRVQFANSDKSANIETAQKFWSSTLQIPAERFRIRLKQHTVSPHRRNIGAGYVGLVRITVPQSVNLNRRIAGWIEGLCQFAGESANGKPSDFGSEYPGSIPGSPVFDKVMPGLEGFMTRNFASQNFR